MSGKTLPLPPKTPTEVSPNATSGIEMRKMDNYSFSTEEPSMKEAHNFSWEIQGLITRIKSIADDITEQYFKSDNFTKDDFEQRLLANPNDPEYREARQRTYTDQRIAPLITSLDPLISHLPADRQSPTRARIEKECLETLILTKSEKKPADAIPLLFWACQWIWEKSEEEIVKIMKGVRHAWSVNLGYNGIERLNQNRLQAIARWIQNTRDIDFSGNDISALDEKWLKIVVSGFVNAQRISLSRTNLGLLSGPKLKIIMEWVRHARSILLSYNNLGLLDKEKLQIIQQNIQDAVSVNLDNNQLETLDEAWLRILIDGLKNAKSISLQHVQLNKLDDTKLRIVMSGIQHASSVILGRNNIGDLNKSRLWILIEGLRNVSNIDLRCNSLETLSEIHLRIFATWLQGAKKIHFTSNGLSPKQKNIILSSLPRDCKAIFSNIKP